MAAIRARSCCKGYPCTRCCPDWINSAWLRPGRPGRSCPPRHDPRGFARETLLLEFDHATGEAVAGIAGGLGDIVVGAGVHDHALADDVGGGAVADGCAVQLAVDLG